MTFFRTFTTLIASLTCFECLDSVSASPASLSDELKPRAPPPGAVLSPNAQALVNQTVSYQQGTGHQWDRLVAQAFLALVKSVETNGYPSKSCTLDNVYVRREW
jgi:hypothetical protein